MGAHHDAGWMRRRRKVPDVIRRGLRLSIGLAICNSLGFLLANSVEGESMYSHLSMDRMLHTSLVLRVCMFCFGRFGTPEARKQHSSGTSLIAVPCVDAVLKRYACLHMQKQQAGHHPVAMPAV